MGQFVELDHHFPVRVLVGPFALEFGGVVLLAVDLRALGDQTGDTGGEFVRDKKAFPERVLNGVGEIGLIVLAVVKS